MTDLAASSESLAVCGELFRLVDAKLFLRFSPTNWGKRTIHKPTGGVLTFGDTPPPIDIYSGNTGRAAVQLALEPKHSQPHQRGGAEVVIADEKDDSLGNVSRGDRI